MMIFDKDKKKSVSFKQTNPSIDRARFSPDSPCLRCEDVGVLRIQMGDVATLALCSCEIGLNQPWKLPSYLNHPNARIQSLPYEQFKPAFEIRTTREVTRFIREKFSWWREKINIAESFWLDFNEKNASEQKQIQGEENERVPF